MKKFIIALAVVGTVASCQFAWAGGSVNVNKASQKAGNVITNGSPSASSSSGAVSGSKSGVKSNIANTNANTSANTNETYSGSSPSQSIGGTSFDRMAPTVVAPSLTSGGIGICLGSFSGGLTGPMAGIAFGKTTVDKGCSQARDAMILHNMGHLGAALRVLSGDSIKDALAAEGLTPANKSVKATVAPLAGEVVVAETQVLSNFGTRTETQGN